MSTVKINGNDVSIQELQDDVKAAFELDYRGKYAFCPETVEALLNYIEELETCLEHAVHLVRFEAGSESEATIFMCQGHNLTL